MLLLLLFDTSRRVGCCCCCSGILEIESCLSNADASKLTVDDLLVVRDEVDDSTPLLPSGLAVTAIVLSL